MTPLRAGYTCHPRAMSRTCGTGPADLGMANEPADLPTSFQAAAPNDGPAPVRQYGSKFEHELNNRRDVRELGRSAPIPAGPGVSRPVSRPNPAQCGLTTASSYLFRHSQPLGRMRAHRV
jgi:hypothetical protein